MSTAAPLSYSPATLAPAPHTPVSSPPRDLSEDAGHPAQRNRLTDLDTAVAVTLDADLRLIYGLAVPVLMVVAAMIPMFLFPSFWIDGVVLIFLMACLGLVIARVLSMLDEDEDEADPAWRQPDSGSWVRNAR